ncbi:hypothetical protein [Streptomyces sp. TE33382]
MDPGRTVIRTTTAVQAPRRHRLPRPSAAHPTAAACVVTLTRHARLAASAHVCRACARLPATGP